MKSLPMVGMTLMRAGGAAGKSPAFNVDERRMQKQRNREADIARVDHGEITGEALNERNGFFSAVDRSTVRIVTWRKRVKLD